MMPQSDLIVVSNRLPVTLESEKGNCRVQKSSGGLVSAVLPILRRHGGCWVGWTGTADTPPHLSMLHGDSEPFALAPVTLSAAERDCYYRGFANEVLWPLFHAMPSRCKFDSSYWREYLHVNRKFARTVQQVSRENSFIWVHDYHLMMQAAELRRSGAEQRIAYFHHIPFPSPETFQALPWRSELLHGLLQFDSIGFQTASDRNHFISCLRRWISAVRITHIGGTAVACATGRTCVMGVYPISVDYEEIQADASHRSTAAEADALRERLGDTQIVLGIDRLDYTKGIPERLRAFQTLLERNPELRGRIALLQFVIPSREEIQEYAELKLKIETLVGKINGKYGKPGWIPVQYFYRSISRSELIALYCAADVALVTPLRDGMNLIAKEFCASRIDLRGVLVLSEFAGAAEQLKCGALLVNPNDADQTASALHQAITMNESAQIARMRAMRSQICEHDVFHWAHSFNLHETPVVSARSSSEECRVR